MFSRVVSTLNLQCDAQQAYLPLEFSPILVFTQSKSDYLQQSYSQQNNCSIFTSLTLTFVILTSKMQWGNRGNTSYELIGPF